MYLHLENQKKPFKINEKNKFEELFFRIVNQRPEGFPPGPRGALPILGHGLQIGNNLSLAVERFRYSMLNVISFWISRGRNVWQR